MKVKNIEWISASGDVAEVEITDGVFTCVAFSYPCIARVNDNIFEPLHIFNIRNAMIKNGADPGVWRLTVTGLDHKVIAEITDISKQFLKIGDLDFVIDDYLPGGVQQGDLIEFECSRIDLW